jgi:predicted PurR-regulated permease PerM
MFLSVPLTMAAKIFFENTPELRWAAVLLGPNPPPPAAPPPGEVA